VDTRLARGRVLCSANASGMDVGAEQICIKQSIVFVRTKMQTSPITHPISSDFFLKSELFFVYIPNSLNY